MIWGVSIPTTSTGPSAVDHRRVEPVAEAAAALGDDRSIPAAPTSPERRRARAPDRSHGARVDRGERVGERGRGQGRGLLGRARVGRVAVLTRPGRGAFAITTTSSPQRRPHVVHGARHAADRAGDLRAPDTRAVADRDLADAPARRRRRAAPSRAASRSGDRAMPEREQRASRRATRIGPRSSSVTPVRRRTERASVRLATRRCQGHASDPASGCRAPSTRSALAGEDGRRDPFEVGTVERAVAVHERHEVRRWRPRARRDTRRRSRAAVSDDHDGAESRATSAEPSVDPLSTTIGTPHRGDAGEHTGDRIALRRGPGGSRRPSWLVRRAARVRG